MSRKLTKREFELLTALEEHDPGRISIFQVYGHSVRTLRTLLEHPDTPTQTIGGVSISREEESGLYQVCWEGKEPNADDYIRVVEGDGQIQIWAAKQASLVELTLLKSNADYDKAHIRMPLNMAFGEKVEPIDLDRLIVREVRHYQPSD